MTMLKRLFSRGTFVFAGVLSLAALIWWIGPLLAIGEMRPLAGIAARLALIALVLLAWAWPRVKRFAPRPALPRRPAAPENTDLDELRARFRTALQRLRAAHKDTWLDRLSGRAAYRLPWYLVIGESGSGKTSALVNGGVALSLADHEARVAGERVEPTRECEWWLGSDAVLIDTPGRYLDAREQRFWLALLALLRRHRARQPLNGVLLTVAIDELLALDEPGRAALGTRLARTLQRLQADLRMDVPIHVCLTKMDRIDGFAEYFAHLTPEQRTQVWGMSFDTNVNANVSANVGTTFASAFSAMAQRLDAGLRDVLIADPDTAARARAFLFPRQFATLAQPLAGFCAALFRHSPLDPALRARGLYFASARQDGTVIDRVLAPVGDRLGAQAPTPASRTHVQGYFLERLLHEALFADAGFAGVSRSQRRRRFLLHAGLAALAGIVLIVALAGWTTSYLNNRAYLREVDAHVAEFARRIPPSMTLAADALPPLTPMLDALDALPRSASFDPAAPPWRHRLGLFEGAGPSAASDAVYRRALDEKLLPQAASRLATLLANAPADDSDYTYDALKAYLMLHDPAHYDAAFVTAWLGFDAARTLPGDAPRETRERLDVHLARLFGARAVASPFPLDTALVARVRERLAREPASERAYHTVRRELLRSMAGEPVSVASAGGPQAALALRRKSGRPLTEGIARLYTYDGYWDVFDKRVGETTMKLQEEDPWVLGAGAAPAVDHTRLVLEVRRAYLNDYADVWDAYLNDLTLVDSPSIARSMQVARTLSAPDSPLRQFLQAAANETHLLRARETSAPAAGALQQRIGAARQSLGALFGETVTDTPPPAADTRPEAIVDDRFEPLRRLVGASDGAPAGAAPFDSNLQVIDELYRYLSSANAALASGNAPPATDVFDKLQADAGRMPMPLRAMLTDLSKSGAVQVGGAARRNLAQDAQGGVGRTCRQMIAGRYPFARHSTRDVALDDFSRLFASGGLMDSFFQKNLASQVDTGRERWAFRRDAGIAGTPGTPGDSRLLSAFQNADTIRRVFFPGNTSAPSLQLDIMPLELDPGITQYALDIDGQALRYAHGPQVSAAVRWPGARGSNLVTLQVSTRDGVDSVQTEGAWALQRLFDHARIAPGAAPETFVASFDFNGRKLALRVSANSSVNPFQLPEMDAFACPS
jgi:type VI secretion system protein ImpL